MWLNIEYNYRISINQFWKYISGVFVHIGDKNSGLNNQGIYILININPIIPNETSTKQSMLANSISLSNFIIA